MTASPTELEQLTALVKETTALVETAMRADLNQALAENDPLLAQVLHYGLMNGGKRVRPMLAVVCSRLCGRDDDELYLLAAAFEYLHVATLIHDDVIDHADSRRGQESVCKKYGLAAAILAGDWLHARSMHLVGSLTGRAGLDIFCAATTAMVDGEFLQLRHAADTEVLEEQYFAVIQRKTACLISSVCEIGALYGGGTPEQRAALAAYGNKIGIAFQIIDDLLDYLGDEQATGKATGNDLAERKITLPLIHALNQAGEQDKNILMECIHGHRSPAEACRIAGQLMHSLDSFTFAKKRAEQEAARGLAGLSLFDRSRHVSSLAALEGLAGYVLNRDR